MLAICAAAHGGVLGCFDLRLEQAVYSAIKLPLLFLGSGLLCLPSFYVLNAVLGLRDDFAAACRGLLASQATLAVCALSLAPLVIVVYVSSDSYRLAVVFNGIVLLAATLGGQVTLSRHYARLIARNPRHRLARRAWLVLYVFVAIQLAWVLRPFIGWRGMTTSFLRQETWDNAYVIVARALLRLLAGG
jgi:hypothetical protein